MRIYQGELRDLRVNVRDASGQPFDLSGQGIEWRARCGSKIIFKEVGDGIEITDPKEGVLTIRLEPDDTSVPGRYRMELRLTSSDLVITALDDTLIVVPSLFGGE